MTKPTHLGEDEHAVLRAVDMSEHLAEQFQLATGLDEGRPLEGVVDCSGGLLRETQIGVRCASSHVWWKNFFFFFLICTFLTPNVNCLQKKNQADLWTITFATSGW